MLPHSDARSAGTKCCIRSRVCCSIERRPMIGENCFSPVPPQSCLRKPRTLVPSPPAKPIAHLLRIVDECDGTRASFVPPLFGREPRLCLADATQSVSGTGQRLTGFRVSDTGEAMLTRYTSHDARRKYLLYPPPLHHLTALTDGQSPCR